MCKSFLNLEQFISHYKSISHITNLRQSLQSKEHESKKAFMVIKPTFCSQNYNKMPNPKTREFKIVHVKIFS